MLRAPLGNGLDLNFRVGDYYGRTAVTQGYALAGTYSPGTITTTVSSLLVGAGASFTFDGHWSAKLDYLKIKRAGDTRTGEFDLDLWTLGTSYTF
jgi:opacity protein-like surface antigen